MDSPAPTAPSGPAAADDGACECPDAGITARVDERGRVEVRTQLRGDAPAPAPRPTPAAKMPIPWALPSMPANHELYYSRKGLPLKLRSYRIPVAMRAAPCRLLDDDEANSGLELLVSTLAHLDMEKAYGVVPELHRPFMLVLPLGVRASEGAPERKLVEFVVDHVARNYAGVVINDLALARLDQFFYKTIMSEACPAMRHPCDIAAAVFLGFLMYNPFVDTPATVSAHVAGGGAADDPTEKMSAVARVDVAVRAGAFAANIILLGENMPPLRAADLAAPLLAVAYSKDLAAWAADCGRDSLMHNECMRAYLRSLRRGCHYCDASPKSMQRCTRCHAIQYCSRECHAADWARHKRFCNENRAAAAEYAKSTQ